jgi:hypothetical protein
VAVRFSKKWDTDQLSLFTEGAMVIVKYIENNKAHIFSSVIKEVCEVPVPLIYLDYPVGIDSVPLANEDESAPLLPVMLSAKSTKFMGSLTNFTVDGAHVIAEAEEEAAWSLLVANTETELNFNLPGTNIPTTLMASVRWSSWEAGKITLGVSFDSLSRTSKRELLRHFAALIPSI